MNFLKDDLVHEANLISRLILDYSKRSLETNNREDAEELLKKIEGATFISAGYLYDSEGNLFAAYRGRSDDSPPAPQQSEYKDTVVWQDDEVFHVKSIKEDGKILGTLYLRLNSEFAETRIENFVITALIVLGSFLVLSYFLALLLQTIISRPVLELAGLLEKVAGENDYSIRAETKSKDEIGRLYDSFNKMIGAINQRDIRQKEIEQNLRISEIKYRELFENIRSSVIILEKTGGDNFIVVDINRTCEDFENIDRRKTIGNKWSSAFPRFADTSVTEMIKRLSQGQTSSHMTLMLDIEQSKWYEFYIYLMLERLIVVVYNDITEKVSAEQVLRRSEEWQKRILESISDGFFVLDKNMRITYFNHKSEELLGRKREQVVDKHIFDEAFPEARGSIFEEQYTAAIRDNKDISFETYFGLEPFDNWYSVVAYAFEGGITVFFQVITEKKKAEEALRESEQNYRTLFKTMHQGVIFQNREGEIISANPAAEKILGIDNENKDTVSFSMSRIACYDEEGNELELEDMPSYRALSEGRRVENQLMGVFNPKDKSIRWINVSSVPQFRPGEDKPYRVFSTFTDMTERKRHAEERERLNNQLQSKNKELEQIIYVTSHDLRSPLVNILGFSAELKESADIIMHLMDKDTLAGDERAHLHEILNYSLPVSLDYITSSAGKIDSLLKGLLYLSRLGRVELMPARIDMNELLKNVLDDFKYRISENDIDVSLEKLPPCYADEGQISQVFANLIDNAIKYTAGRENPKIKISGWHEIGMSKYIIEDNGIGIAPEHQEKIFELFHRLDPENTEGEGLGLNIVSKILERNRGGIDMESKPGRGTKFYVLLPSKK
jgi:PAS domain S-box-containing protein